MSNSYSNEHQVALVTLVVVVTSLVGSAEAVFGIPEFLEFGACAQINVVSDFDRLRYSGVWYDMARVPNEYQVAKHCVTQNYTWTADDHQFHAIVKGLTAEERKVYIPMVLVNDEVEGEDGHWRPKPPADMTVVADGMPDSPYQVLATDYDHYSCIYSCSEYFGFRASFLWVSSRGPQIEPQYYQTCRDTFTSYGIDHSKLFDVRQGETCPYYSKFQATSTTSTTTTTTTTTTTMDAPPPTTTTTTTLSPSPSPSPQSTSPRFNTSGKKHVVGVKTEGLADHTRPTQHQVSNNIIDEPPRASTWGKQHLVQPKGKTTEETEDKQHLGAAAPPTTTNTQDEFMTGRASTSMRHSSSFVYLFPPVFVLVLLLTA